MRAFIGKGKNFILMLADTDSLAIYFNQRNVVIGEIDFIKVIGDFEPVVLFGQCV